MPRRVLTATPHRGTIGRDEYERVYRSPATFRQNVRAADGDPRLRRNDVTAREQRAQRRIDEPPTRSLTPADVGKTGEPREISTYLHFASFSARSSSNATNLIANERDTLNVAADGRPRCTKVSRMLARGDDPHAGQSKSSVRRRRSRETCLAELRKWPTR